MTDGVLQLRKYPTIVSLTSPVLFAMLFEQHLQLAELRRPFVCRKPAFGSDTAFLDLGASENVGATSPVAHVPTLRRVERMWVACLPSLA